MDWMYKGNPNEVDPEDFLLGRKIDKSHFREPSPNNFMRSVRDENIPSHSQSDSTRKLKEDPLTTIREKELEKKKLLVKRILLKQSDPILANTTLATEPKPSKSLEQIIVENLKKIPYNIDLEKFYHSIKKKKKDKKQESNDSDESEKFDKKLALKNKVKGISESKARDRENSLHKKYLKDTNNESIEDRRDFKREKFYDNREERHNESKYHEQEYRRENRDYRSSRSENRNYYDRSRRKRDYSTDSRDKKYEPSKSSRSYYSKEYEKNNDDLPHRTKHQNYSSTDKPKVETNRQKSTLSEKEKEQKRKEMMMNAIELTEERKKKVKRFEEEDKKEIEKNGEFKRDFAKNQLSTLLSSDNSSVEKRIKSNMYNIQRSDRDMDLNFARKY